MMLHAAVRKASSGEVIRLLATDPSTQRDVPQFCRFLNHELLVAEADEERGTFHYLIRKLG